MADLFEGDTITLSDLIHEIHRRCDLTERAIRFEDVEFVLKELSSVMVTDFDENGSERIEILLWLTGMREHGRELEL